MYVEGGGKRGEEDEHICTRDIRQHWELQSWENCTSLSYIHLSSAISLSSIAIAQPAALPAFTSLCSLSSTHKFLSPKSPSY